MKKMFCIDIDGTLLKSNGTISDNTVSIIKKLKGQGHEIVLCSARSRNAAIGICKLIDTSKYVISSNGAEIYDYHSSNIIKTNAIDKATCIDLWNICNSSGFKISYAVNDIEYVNTPFWEGQITIDDINCIDLELVKSIMIVFDNYDDGIRLFERIKSSDIVKSCCNKIEKDDCGYWFNVLDKNTSKGLAVEELSNLLSISKNNIVSFGNDYNDISMFKISAEGCAVSNSDLSLKQIATKIILSNDEDGVANYILDNYLNM